MTFRSYFDVNNFLHREINHTISFPNVSLNPRRIYKKKNPNLNKMKKLSCRTLHVE